MIKKIIWSLLILMCLGTMAWSIPGQISFQGVLKDAAGHSVNDNLSMVFTIYDAASGGSSLWTETQTVSIEGGLYNVSLGAATPITATVFNGSTRYLGVKVSTDSEMTPRIALVSAPYAFRAAVVDTVSDESVTTAKIVDGAVTNAKLAGSITGAKFATNISISTTGIITADAFYGDGSELLGITVADGAVTTAKIANSAVTTGKIATSNSAASNKYLKYDGTNMLWATVSGGSGSMEVDNLSIDTNANGSLEVKDGGITSSKLASDLNINTTGRVTVSASVPSDGAIDAENLGAGGYGITGIGDYGVRGDGVSGGIYATSTGSTGNGVYSYAIGSSAKGVYGYAGHFAGVNYGVYGKTDSSNGYSGYFTGGRGAKVVGTLEVTGRISGDGSALTGITVSDGSITTLKIADSAITAAKITDEAITSGKIAAGAVTGSKLSSNLEINTTGLVTINATSGNDGNLLEVTNNNSSGYAIRANNYSGTALFVYGLNGITSYSTASNGFAVRGSSSGAGGKAVLGIGNDANAYAGYFAGGKGVSVEGDTFITGVLTATTFNGDGSALTGITVSDEAITTPKIANSAITTAKIAATAPTGEKYLKYNGSNLVWATVSGGGSTSREPDYITIGLTDAYASLEVLNAAISTAKIVDNAVTATKIADSAVTNAKIADGAVTASKLASDVAVLSIANAGSSRLTGAVDLKAGTNVTLSQSGNTIEVSASGGGSSTAEVDNISIGLNSNGSLEVKDSGVDAAKIADNAITTAKITAEAVTSGKIASNAVTTVKITNEAITEPKLSITNEASAGKYLSWNGNDMEWLAVSSGNTVEVDNTTIGLNASGSLEVKDSAITIGKIATTNVATGEKYLKYTGSNLMWATVSGGGSTSREPDYVTIGLTDVYGSLEVLDAAITNAKIGPAAVTADKLASDLSIVTTGTIEVSGSRAGAAIVRALNTSSGDGVQGIAEGTTGKGGYFLASGNTGTAIEGNATATGAAANYGGMFIAEGNSGVGVHGYASATSGTNYGVYGHTQSSSGYAGYFDGGKGVKVVGSLEVTGVISGDGSGLTGINATIADGSIAGPKLASDIDITTTGSIQATGNLSGVGVIRATNSGSGYGVEGTSSDGVGGFFTSNGIGGHGVYGTASNAAGHGGHFTSSGSGGYGVYSKAENESGTTYGVWGETTAPIGIGVVGKAGDTGTNYGIYGQTGSSSGYSGYFTGGGGVRVASGGLNVTGTTTSTAFSGDGTGLTNIPATSLANGSITGSKLASDISIVTSGNISTTSQISATYAGGGFAVSGTANGANAYGIYGHATEAHGEGVYGEGNGTGGYGVHGHSSAADGYGLYGDVGSTGVNYAVFGVTNSENGYAGYFQGGKGVYVNDGGLQVSGIITGEGSGLTNISSAALADGAVTSSKLASDVAINTSGIITALGFNGNGSGITQVNAATVNGFHASTEAGTYTLYPLDAGGNFNLSNNTGTTIVGTNTGSGGTGISGRITGVGGYAVHGVASDTSAQNYGGYFEAAGINGRGVYGRATGASGIGIYGFTGVSDGYGGYFYGGKGVKVVGSLEVTGIISGDGSGITGITATTAETVNGIHASTEATANNLYPLDSNKAFTLSVNLGENSIIKGTNTNSTNGIGVAGRAYGEAGVGVNGFADAGGDVYNYGGSFTALGNFGRGVYGEGSATGTAAHNYGGYFQAAGDYGVGAHGYANGANGKGVYGQAAGTSGKGVHGYASGTNGVGVYGQVLETTAYAGYFTGGKGVRIASGGLDVTGIITGDGSGITGVRADTLVPDISIATTGTVNVNTGSDIGIQATAVSIGISGEATLDSNGGIGVKGEATDGASLNFGGVFISRGLDGSAGVSAETTNPDGANYGGYFLSAGSANSAGVYGKAIGSSGENYGVYGVTNSPDGYGGYFTGGKGVRIASGGLDVTGIITGDGSRITGVTATTAETVDGIHASTTAQANKLLALNADKRFIVSGDKASVGMISGTNTNEIGYGVYGYASATGVATNFGGMFAAAGDSGYGVYGEASGANGTGVYGNASATGVATNFGGTFWSAGDNGRGVFGYATGANGRGVYGYTAGANGYGVYGQALQATGYAGYFDGGKGVKVVGSIESTGTILATGSPAYKATIRGINSGVYGVGVSGEASDWNGKGVAGYATGAAGIGVYGKATSTTGSINYGVKGEADGETGIGVYGKATTSTTGHSPLIGVMGEAVSAAGTGVHAVNTHATTASDNGQALYVDGLMAAATGAGKCVGTDTFPSGESYANFTHNGVSNQSLILIVLGDNPGTGVAVKYVVPGSNTDDHFWVYLTGTAVRPVPFKYLVIN
ncbi:MAG: hypothetical protein NT099_06385 [Candidatus Saganbacteria bacterium]|nr:hypothetical protein [Candidatus Saganbacteria bacterium]